MRPPRPPRRPPASRGERCLLTELVWTVTLILTVASVGKGEENIDCYRWEDKGASYIGNVSVTINGLECMRWDTQDPWTHQWDPSNHPGKNLTSNYCRNPDEGDGPWCYTTNPDVSFEYCNVSVCPNATTPLPTTTTLATTTTTVPTTTTTVATTTTALATTTTTAATTTTTLATTTTTAATTTTTLATTTATAATTGGGATPVPGLVTHF